MTNSSFQQLKMDLDEACTSLRSFTLGKPGCTRKQGEEGMELINRACAKLSNAFGPGLQAQSVKSAIAMAHGCMEAAKARMAILKSKH